MAKKRTLNLAMLNIKTQPHSHDGYRKLIKTARGKRLLGKIRGSDWGIIGSTHDGIERGRLSEEDFWKEYYIYGDIYRYLNIDPESAWLDIDSSLPLEPGDQAIPSIDHRLKPNRKDIPYIFFPKRHRMIFDTKCISPHGMSKLMAAIFSSEKIKEEFGRVDVEVESTQEAIDMILDIPRITEIDIQFTIPNDDDFGYRNADEIIRRLEEMEVRANTQKFTSNSEKGLQPDDELLAEMDIARSNGRVTAKGNDGDTKIVRSTDNHPLVKKELFDSDAETHIDAMLRASVVMLPRVRRRGV